MMKRNLRYMCLLCTAACILIVSPTARAQDDQGFEKLTLKIATTAKDVLPLEPLPITITLSNNTAEDAKHTPLYPGVDFLHIYVARDDGSFELFRTADWPIYCWIGDPVVTIHPGEVVSVSGYLYYASAEDPDKERGRYLFETPGTYRIKATLKNRDSTKEIESNVMKVEAVEPAGEDALAYEFLKALEEREEKDVSYARLLLSSGQRKPTLRQRKMMQKQEEFLSRFPNSRYSRYVCYSLGLAYRRGTNVQRGLSLLEKAGGYDDFFLADDALGLLVETCVTQRNLEKAKQHLSDLKKRFPDSPVIPQAEHYVAGLISETRPR